MPVSLNTRCRFLITAIMLGVASMGTFQSCVSTKGLVYFQGDTARYAVDSIREIYTSTIQPNDLLSIVIGSLSPERMPYSMSPTNTPPAA